MTTAQQNTLLRHIRKLAAAPAAREQTDRQLLDDFAASRDEAAFAGLVARHGPMVLRVCRRVLGHEQDAEDAFQATFLVLARHIRTIRRREAVAGWLHGVAYRTAMKAKRSAARRRNHEARLRELPPRQPATPTWDDVQAVLDDEIGRLSESFRAAFVQCVLEDKTVPQAAAELGVKEGTVSSRLTRARHQLRQRLAHRGIKLSAVLAALTLTEGASKAVVPAALTQAAVSNGLLVAAGGSAAGVIPSHVAALAAGVTRAMLMTKVKLATVVCVAMTLFAGAGVLTHHALVAQETQPPVAQKIEATAPTEGAEPQPKVKADKDATTTYAGRVLDPEGKPVAGAKLFLLYYTPKALPIPVRGTSGEDGRFSFTLTNMELDKSGSREPWNEAQVVALKDGYGLGVPRINVNAAWTAVARVLNRWKPTDQTLYLVKDDVPASGRVLDLQGQPVAGVRVSIQELHWPLKGDLALFFQDLKEKKVFYPPLRDRLMGFEGEWIGRDAGTLFPTATTDADGRFHIKGVGRERLVAVRLEGPTIVARKVYLATRSTDIIQVPGHWRSGDDQGPISVYGPGSSHVAAPSKPVVGIVRDKDTGKPIPGAIVTSYQFAGSKMAGQTQLRTVADKDGRYRLDGMPKGAGSVISAGPPDGEPYLTSTHRIGDTPGLDPIAVDIKLKRGVWIAGKVLDKVTGKPVHAQVQYAAFADNPHTKEVPGLSAPSRLESRAEDGTFRVVGLPGRGLVGALAWDDRYRRGAGADKIAGLDPSIGYFRTVPYYLLPENFHTLIEVNPADDADAVTCAIALDIGRSLTGTILDPDGTPLAGARIRGLNDHGWWSNHPQKSADFTVTALEPGRPRLLQFAHLEKRLAGFLVLKGDEKKPFTVKIEPSGTLTGRLVTPDGKPVTAGEILGRQGPLMSQPSQRELDMQTGTFPQEAGKLDKDGKFRIEGLAPGLTYRLGLRKGDYLHNFGGAAAGKLTITAGETKDLGDVVVLPIE